MRLHVNAHAQ